MTINVGVIYFSGTGKTAAMAEAILAGAQSVADTTVHDLRITGAMINEGRWDNAAFLETLGNCEAVLFGTPTYMGGPAAQFKTFADALGEAWYTRSWSGKVAGGFTTSGGLSGDKQGTLLYLTTLAMQLGMIWVGQDSIPGQMSGVAEEEAINRISSYIGVMGQA
jgi:NAD(P)H dehydrogenase (quinone)